MGLNGLQCIFKNLIKHLSFVYTQLNDQTIRFQTIQSNISHLFALSFNVKQFYLTHRENPRVLAIWARVDLEVMALKGCAALPKVLALLLEPHHQIIKCHIHDTHWESLTPSAEIQSVYSAAPVDEASVIFKCKNSSISSKSV